MNMNNIENIRETLDAYTSMASINEANKKIGDLARMAQNISKRLFELEVDGTLSTRTVADIGSKLNEVFKYL